MDAKIVVLATVDVSWAVRAVPQLDAGSYQRKLQRLNQQELPGGAAASDGDSTLLIPFDTGEQAFLDIKYEDALAYPARIADKSMDDVRAR